MVYWLPYSSHTSHHPSQISCLPWIFYATQKLMLDSWNMVQKQFEEFHKFLWNFFPSLKQNFIAYRSSKMLDCIFEIHQLWQSGFNRVYSNSCCRCSFEPEILKIGPSSHKMYSNNIMNFQESTTILNACTKKFGNLLNTPRGLICRKTQPNQAIYIEYISIKRTWHYITFNSWYAIKPNQTRSYVLIIYV